MSYATTLVLHLYIGENNGSSDLPRVGPNDTANTLYYRAGANNSDLTVGNKVTLNKDFVDGDPASVEAVVVKRRTATYGWLTRRRMTQDMFVPRAA